MQLRAYAMICPRILKYLLRRNVVTNMSTANPRIRVNCIVYIIRYNFEKN